MVAIVKRSSLTQPLTKEQGDQNMENLNAGKLESEYGVAVGASVDGEIAVWKGTTGKVLRRTTLSGLLKAVSGVLQTVLPADIVSLLGTTPVNAATLATNADEADNSDKLGGFPANAYVRKVNNTDPDADGNVIVNTGVTSFNGAAGPITAAQSAAATIAGLGYTPANPANAGSDHNHNASYAGRDAVVSIGNAAYNYNNFYCTVARANGATFTFTTRYDDLVGSSCVHAFSCITTEEGDSYACDVRPGDRLVSADGIHTVLAVKLVPLGMRKPVQINGRLVVTKDHIIPTLEGLSVCSVEEYCGLSYGKSFSLKSDRGVVVATGGSVVPSELTQLKTGMHVITVNGAVEVESVEEVEGMDASELMYSFLLENGSTFIADGIVVNSLEACI